MQTMQEHIGLPLINVCGINRNISFNSMKGLCMFTDRHICFCTTVPTWLVDWFNKRILARKR